MPRAEHISDLAAGIVSKDFYGPTDAEKMRKVEIARRDAMARSPDDRGIVAREGSGHGAGKLAIGSQIEHLLPRTALQQIGPMQSHGRHPRTFDELPKPNGSRQRVACITAVSALYVDYAMNELVNSPAGACSGLHFDHRIDGHIATPELKMQPWLA
jgi:hypothetical protein